jgi:hypothetical protein
MSPLVARSSIGRDHSLEDLAANKTPTLGRGIGTD